MPELSRFYGIVIRMFGERDDAFSWAGLLGGSRRFGRRAVEHGIYRVRGFEQLGTYTLCVSFDDGTTQVIDFEPVLRGALYGPLRDPELFKQVRIDDEAYTLVWPNDADFDPETLHDWPKVRDAFVRLASSWR